MSTLHVLSHSPFGDERLGSCLRVIGPNDALLLSGDATYALQPGTAPFSSLHARNLKLFVLAEDAQAAQREITLESLALVKSRRADFQVFNELLVQYPRRGQKKLGQVVPDNMVVIYKDPIKAELSFDTPLQPAEPACPPSCGWTPSSRPRSRAAYRATPTTSRRTSTSCRSSTDASSPRTRMRRAGGGKRTWSARVAVPTTARSVAQPSPRTPT